MDVRFVLPDLRRIDRLRAEALCLGFFEDERPLQGALGLVDWRLCGRLSRLIGRGQLDGALGERLLLPGEPRLPFDKVLLFGLGPREAFVQERFEATVHAMLVTLQGVQARSCAMGLPGRPEVPPEDAMERFLAVTAQHSEHDEVTLIEDHAAQRAMEPIVERARRRARAYAP